MQVLCFFVMHPFYYSIVHSHEVSFLFVSAETASQVRMPLRRQEQHVFRCSDAVRRVGKATPGRHGYRAELHLRPPAAGSIQRSATSAPNADFLVASAARQPGCCASKAAPTSSLGSPKTALGAVVCAKMSGAEWRAQAQPLSPLSG